MKQIYEWVRAKDTVCPPSNSKLNFDGEIKQKTLIGGIMSIFIQLYVLWIAVQKGLIMLGLDNPYMTTLERTFDYNTGKVNINNLPTTIYSIKKRGDRIPYDDDFKKHLLIVANYYERKYDEYGDESQTQTIIHTRPCNAADFEKNEYEQKYWKAFKDYELICIDDPTNIIQMYGTRDSRVYKQDHAFFILEVIKCTDKKDYKQYGNPDCEPDAEATKKYTEDINLVIRCINDNADYKNFEGGHIRQYEVFAPDIPLSVLNFTDAGYRYRKNEFQREDEWLFPDKQRDLFYDFIYFNSDTFLVEDDTDYVAEIYFRLQADEVLHTRIVMSFMDWVGALGGVTRILLKMTGWFIGGYAAFNSMYASVANFYQVKSEKKLFNQGENYNPEKPDLQDINLPLLSQLQLYMVRNSSFSCLCCCLKTARMKNYIKIVDQGQARLKQEFNFRKIKDNQHIISYELDMIKREMGQEVKDLCNMPNPAQIIDYDKLKEEQEKGKK